MKEEQYTKRELDHYFGDVKTTLLKIEIQTTKTNGRVTRIEKIILILITAMTVLLITSGSSLVSFIKTLVL